MSNALICDILVVVIGLGFMLRGYVRGLVLTIASVAVMICSIVGANLAVDVLSPPITQMIEPSVELFLQEQLEAQLGQGDELVLESLLEDTPLAGMQGYLDNDAIDGILQNMSEFTSETLETLAQAIANGIVGTVLWILAFLLLYIGLSLLARAVDLVAKLPVLRTINGLGGLAAGAVQGLLVLFILNMVLGGFGYLPTAAVAAQTYVYQHLMAYNPLDMVNL